MPSINGFFQRGWGVIHAQVGVVTVFCAGKWLEIEFKIDTGASATLLMDNDFLQVCHALGWNFYVSFREGCMQSFFFVGTIVGNCLLHGRRQFVDVANNFPQECLYVFEILNRVEL